jgi:hypothetical protein
MARGVEGPVFAPSTTKGPAMEPAIAVRHAPNRLSCCRCRVYHSRNCSQVFGPKDGS